MFVFTWRAYGNVNAANFAVAIGGIVEPQGKIHVFGTTWRTAG